MPPRPTSTRWSWPWVRFCTPDDNKRECDEWNTGCTARLKKWSTRRGRFSGGNRQQWVAPFKDKHLKEWLTLRPLAVRPISSYTKISSDAYTCFNLKRCMSTKRLLKPVSPLNRDKSGKIGHFQAIEIWTFVPAIFWFLVVCMVKMWSDRRKK